MAIDWNGSCSFSFDIPDYTDAYPWCDSTPNWALGTGSSASQTPGIEDETWHCPHDAVSGFDRCAFHMPPERRADAELDVSSALMTAVREANGYDRPAKQRRYCQFIGAEFPELRLEQTILGGGSRATIDFRHAEFGVVACERAEFGQTVRFDGAVFDPGPDPPFAPGTEVLDPKLSEIPFPIDFTHATFQDVAYFRGAAFHQPALFRDATFADNAAFGSVRFYDHVSFLTADFEDIAMFKDGRFDRDARFQAVDCIDLVDFKRSYIGGRFSLDRIVCDGDIEIDDADMTAPPTDAGRSTDIERFEGEVTADKAVVTGRLSCNRITLDSEIRIRDADISELRLRSPRTNGDTAYVDLHGSNVQEGPLTQPADDDGDDDGDRAAGAMLYDCYRTTLGAVEFYSEDGGAVASRVRFLRTKYDGYDFTDTGSIDLKEIGHKIHQFTGKADNMSCYCDDGSEHSGRYIIDEPVCPIHSREQTDDALQSTYAYAKTGAKAAGNNESAGAFFYLERVASRRGQLQTATQNRAGTRARLNALSKWARSLLMSVTTGYGEHPYRVFVSSFVITVGFGGVYRGTELRTDHQSVIDTLVFSFQSFISFILGPPDTTSLVVEGIIAVEGFIGAFFIGLFVFTLTRRVQR